MPESQKPHWYQDGGTVLFILLMGGFFSLMIFQALKPEVFVRVSGQVHQPLIESQSFEVSVWHHVPGDLKRGSLTIRVEGQGVPTGKQDQTHSFETWSPNKDQALTFQFPLANYQPEHALTVVCVVSASNARTTTSRFVWQHGGWVHP